MRRPASISELPDMLALFPLSRALLLPGSHRPLNVFEPRFVAMVDDALAGNRMIGLIQPRDTAELGEDAVDRPRLLTVLRAHAEFSDIEVDWDEIEDMATGELVDLAAMLGPYGGPEKQALLEARTLVERAETLMALAEIEMARARSGVVLQ